VRPADEQARMSLRERAEQLLYAEMSALLRHDDARHPQRATHKADRKRPRPEAAPPVLDELDERDLKVWQTAISLLFSYAYMKLHVCQHDNLVMKSSCLLTA
jgi:hypothetical protein